jgi:hypothetical protein
MNGRRLAVLGLVGLLVLAGCTGTSEVSQEELSGEASYDWDADAKTTFNLSRGSYTTVVHLQNQSTLRVYERDALGSEAPVDLTALRFRFPNGTVVNASEANVSVTRANNRAVVRLPADNGTVGYSASRSGKRFASPVFVAGSQAVVLPPSARIGVPLLSQASPGGYDTTVEGNRMAVRWANVSDGTLNVRYYLERDLLLFSGLVVLALGIGGGGAIYYLRKIRRLEARRKEYGMDVDDDPQDRGPPPGMN